MGDSDSTPRHLTTRQGHPVVDNQSQRTVGDRGPATLENYQFLEKISHFDRERIPERIVHARGFVAHGYFEAYGTVGDEPAVDLYAGQAVPGAGQADAGHDPLLDGDRRPRLVRGGPGSRAASRSSSEPRTATGTWSATTCRCSSSATRSSSRT